MIKILLALICLLFAIPVWSQPAHEDPVIDKLEWKNHKIVVTRGADKQKSSWTETMDRTVDLKKETHRRYDTYTYYPTGEVDVILMKWFENNKLTKTIRVKHYKGGQPQTTITIPKEVIPR